MTKIQAKISSCEFCECVSLLPPSNGEGLTLIWVRFLVVRFEVGEGGGVKLPALSKTR